MSPRPNVPLRDLVEEGKRLLAADRARPPYAEAGVENGQATSTCPACGDVSRGSDHKASARAYAEHYAAEHGPRARSYVIGLPVVMTVLPDGTVTAEVDLSEASDLDEASIPDGQDPALAEGDRTIIENAVIQARVKVSA